jgi:hypothetical protein
MTPLHQLVDALLDTTDHLIDEIDPHATLLAVLGPLEQLYEPRDLLVATAVLETVAPMLHQTGLLLAVPACGRPV